MGFLKKIFGGGGGSVVVAGEPSNHTRSTHDTTNAVVAPPTKRSTSSSSSASSSDSQTHSLDQDPWCLCLCVSAAIHLFCFLSYCCLSWVFVFILGASTVVACFLFGGQWKAPLLQCMYHVVLARVQTHSFLSAVLGAGCDVFASFFQRQSISAIMHIHPPADLEECLVRS